VIWCAPKEEGATLTTNTDLITSFYEAFQRKDYEAMNACYGPSIVFSDPVFQHLEGEQVKAMWHMLCERGTDLVVTFSDVTETDEGATAHWEASYTLAGSDRQINNVIDARFVIRDGLIYGHTDSFDLWAWTRMALGAPGTLLGWSGPIQNKVRDTAGRQLNRFISEHPEYEA
jgi:ketosteroid isomerase-like protein